jgi:hypothetical protein
MIENLRDIRMSLEDLWDKVLGWARLKRRRRFDIYTDIDETGLISETYTREDLAQRKDALAVPQERQQSLDKLQEGFDRLVDQLEHINTNFNHHLSLQKELMDKIAQMPRIMDNFPSAIENQQRMMEQLGEQFKAATAANHEFIDIVKKMPEESMRQTDTLISINRQLGVSADTDIVMNENFLKFNATLEKLSSATSCQTDSVLQMSKTFAASDRYLKYLVARQNKRFMWVFFVAVGVCVVAILSLVTIIAFIK